MAFFSLTFLTWLFIGSLVLTGVAAIVLVILLVQDSQNKNIW